jgi:molecular chaperone DnaJ
VLPLDTLDETVELELEPGTQPGTELVLTGHGLPRLRSTGRVDGRGDLHVHVEVDVPTKLDARQTELLRELASLRGEEDHVIASSNGRAGGIFSRLRARHR